MIPADRQRRIMELIAKDHVVQVHELSELFSVSELTVRRDLDQLASDGFIERTHGGATQRRALPVEPLYSEKSAEQREQKIAIARKAAQFIQDGDTVFINSGSTTYEVISALRDKQITVVTNNIDAARAIDEGARFTLIFVGGIYRSRSHSVSGTLSSSIIQQIYANKSIIGVDGISLASGLTTPVIEEAQTTRQMIERTVGSVIVVADGNKIGVISNFVTASVDSVDIIITDEAGGRILNSRELQERDISLVIG